MGVNTEPQKGEVTSNFRMLLVVLLLVVKVTRGVSYNESGGETSLDLYSLYSHRKQSYQPGKEVDPVNGISTLVPDVLKKNLPKDENEEDFAKLLSKISLIKDPHASWFQKSDIEDSLGQKKEVNLLSDGQENRYDSESEFDSSDSDSSDSDSSDSESSDSNS